MRKLLLTAFIGCLLCLASNAQIKPTQTVKISTPTVQCGMCKEKIETYLKRIDGVMMVNVNYKKKETTVKFISDRTNEEILKAAIVNSGYDANEIAANPESYKALPKCCKKPEDGGGMPKN